MNFDDWTTEFITSGEVHCHKIKRLLYSEKGLYHKLEIIETESYGRGLFLDGRIQHVEYDEYVYSEAIVHPATILLGEKCKRVLVAGGGPGGAIRELLKYWQIDSITQVEIDPAIIELSKKYFSHISQGYHEKPRVNVVISDIRKFIKDCCKEYDLIIYDLSEPLEGSPAKDIFEIEHIKRIKDRLSENGIFVTWAGSIGPAASNLADRIAGIIESIFPVTEKYICHTYSYGTLWMNIMGSAKQIYPLKLSIKEIEDRIKRYVKGSLRFYDGPTHHHIFLIPKDLRFYEKIKSNKKREFLSGKGSL